MTPTPVALMQAIAADPNAAHWLVLIAFALGLLVTVAGFIVNERRGRK